MMRAYEKSCAKQFCSEPIHFAHAVIAFEKEQDLQKKKEALLNIRNTYILVKATEEINIASFLRKKLRSELPTDVLSFDEEKIPLYEKGLQEALINVAEPNIGLCRTQLFEDTGLSQEHSSASMQGYLRVTSHST